MTRRGLMRSVLHDTRIRRLVGAFGIMALAGHGAWLTITVWAFSRGGVAEAGLAGFAQLAPVAVFAPLTSYAADRFRRDRVLAVSFGCATVAAFATSLAIAADAAAPVVYACSALVAMATSLGRPTMNAIIPGVTDTPAAMTASNAVVELVDACAVCAGPALAGFVLVSSSPGAVFGVVGVAALLAATLVSTVRFDANRVRPTGAARLGAVHAEMRAGFAMLRRDPPVAATLGVVALGFAVMGASDVLFVVVASDILGDGNGTAGLLAAAAGFGSVVGAWASLALTGRANLRKPFVASALLGGVPLLLMIDAAAVAIAMVGLFAAGAGWSLLTVAGRAMVQRATPDNILARVFGVFEGVTVMGLGVGALTVGSLATSFGLAWAIAAVALALPIGAVACWRLLGRADTRAAAVDPVLVGLLRSVDFLGPIGPVALAQLSLSLRPVRVACGETVIRMGDVGDRFYLVAEGWVRVHRGDAEVGIVTVGGYVGEVALVLGIPRTASVTALEDTLLYRLGREVFLEAVTGHPSARDQAEFVSLERTA